MFARSRHQPPTDKSMFVWSCRNQGNYSRGGEEEARWGTYQSARVAGHAFLTTSTLTTDIFNNDELGFEFTTTNSKTENPNVGNTS